MKAWNQETHEVVHGDPVCGVDFCDCCGECLVCFGAELCQPYTEAEHVWIIDTERAQELV